MSKIMIITGASSGIGKVCAEYFSVNGYIVYGVSRNISNTDIKYHTFEMDVTSNESIDHCINKIIEKERRIDILINNAGIGLIGSIEDTNVNEAQMLFNTNLFGIHRVCKKVIPIMRNQNEGSIIMIGSLAGLYSVPYLGFYAASKFALEGLSEALRFELRPFNIDVLLIELGTFKTNLTKNSIFSTNAKNSSVYNDNLNTFLKINSESEQNAPDIIIIPKLINKILNKRNPGFRYKVSNFSEIMLYKLKKFLPFKLYEKLIIRFLSIS